jgi:hypothetical protein
VGRPPLGKRAMSTAERQRRYWERVLGRGAKSAEAAEATIADLRRQLAQARADIKRLQEQLAARPKAEKPPRPRRQGR